MASTNYRCPYCGRNDFKSQRGLSQHQKQNKSCKLQLDAHIGIDSGYFTAHHALPLTQVQSKKTDELRLELARYHGKQMSSKAATFTQKRHQVNTLSGSKRHCAAESRQQIGSVDEIYITAREQLSEDNNFPIIDTSSEDSEEETNGNQLSNTTNTELRQIWQDYVNNTQETYCGFTDIELKSIRLAALLREKTAALNTYDSVMDWHLREIGDITPQQKLGDSVRYIPQKRLYKLLAKRYDIMQNGGGQLKKYVTLPHSKARVTLVHYDVKEAMISLLTDPRILDSDYMFFADNPLAPPPETINYIEDLNTGLAYTETYKRLIQRPGKQVLLPVIFYIDGATTGQFSDLPIKALKFTLGIFNRKARDKQHLWRILGFVPEVSRHKSRARRLMRETGHVDSVIADPMAFDNAGVDVDENVPKPQDFHVMLDAILASYVELQNTGFVWDLMYKGKLYKDVEFVLFTPFFKVDGDEADELCGKYKVRTSNVGCLCRYCECPTHESDDPYIKAPLKTKANMMALVASGNEAGLKKVSQHRINNALYKIRFGDHNLQGIHGACPMDMLHATHLGTFKYVRDMFFEQTGVSSKLSDDFNGLSVQYGHLLQRQSQRDLPKTSFNSGIRKGKLTAKEYPGVLLCLVASLRSTKGLNAINTRQAFKEGEKMAIRDWIMLIETLLQWEVWLRSDNMKVNHVWRARKKHRSIMYMLKLIGKREKGMGLKLVKFHAIMHMARDILHFGVPMEYDTGSNEVGHKDSKKSARLTQRIEQVFEEQTALRLEELHNIQMVKEELAGYPLWKYGENTRDLKEVPKTAQTSEVTGAKLTTNLNAATGIVEVRLQSPSTGDGDIQLETGFVDFVRGLQVKLGNATRDFVLRTELRRKGVIFRANSNYRNKVWRDWVMLDWGNEEGHLPVKLWGFVDLSDYVDDIPRNYGNCDLHAGVFAICEASAYTPEVEGEIKSELFIPLKTLVGGFTGGKVTLLSFYLVNVEAFVKPITVIPDLGGETNAYFELKDREIWREDFIKWLEDPYEEEMND